MPCRDGNARTGRGPHMTKISLRLNGRDISHEVAPRQSLADFLRETLHLTGTHLGCEHGACGACTVEMDGMPVRSCIVLAAMSDGRTIETVEGTRTDDAMNIIRRHFHEKHALQCGFCTPGMLLMARDIIRRHKRPDEAAIRAELSG